MLEILIYLVLLLVGVAIVYWLVTKLNLPEPVMYVVYAVLAILCLVALADLAGMGPGWLPKRT